MRTANIVAWNMLALMAHRQNQSKQNFRCRPRSCERRNENPCTRFRHETCIHFRYYLQGRAIWLIGFFRCVYIVRLKSSWKPLNKYANSKAPPAFPLWFSIYGAEKFFLRSGNTLKYRVDDAAATYIFRCKNFDLHWELHWFEYVQFLSKKKKKIRSFTLLKSF